MADLAGGGVACPAQAQPATVLAHPARLEERGTHQGRARGARRLGGNRGWHCSPASSSPAPASPQSAWRSFPSCSAAVPTPPRAGGKVAPSHPEAVGRARGRRVPTGCGVVRCPLSEEARWPLAGSGREPRLQAASVGRRVGSRVAAAGGRRLEAGAGGGAGAGRAVGHGWVEGRHSLRGLDSASAPAPLPLSPASSAGVRGPASGVSGKLGGTLAGVEGSVRVGAGMLCGAAADT